MTISEPNPAVKPTGAEAGEFLGDEPLSTDAAAGDDPTRRPTGTSPLESAAEDDRAADPDDGSSGDGFAMLDEDHREIARLFDAVQQGDGDAILRELCEQLTRTSQREAAAIEPALRRDVDGGDDLADRMQDENAAMATMIAELYDSATPERIPELVAALHEAVEAHSESIDTQIIPALRQSNVDARQLASALRAATPS